MFRSQDIKNRLKAEPFQPFRIVTSTGTNYDIFHPELVMVGTRDLLVGIESKNDPTIYKSFSHIAIMHVTELILLPTESASQKDNAQA